MLEDTFNNFKEKQSHIFFEGQIYYAYSLLLEILNNAKEEIIIIDINKLENNEILSNILDHIEIYI